VEQIENAPQLVNAIPEDEPNRFVSVDGMELELPYMVDLDLDEEQILYDIANVAQPDFMPAHPESPPEVQRAVELLHVTRTRNPAYKLALVTIALRRKFPGEPLEDLRERAGRVNAFEVELGLYGKADATEDAAAEDAAKENPPRTT